MNSLWNIPKSVEKWGCYQITVEGPKDGNPFLEQTITGVFCHQTHKVTVSGFYDGDGVYRVRFMPSFEGEYHYSIKASFLQDELIGSFRVSPASSENHGPVRVANTYSFMYEDGTPYFCSGTSCYVWHLQSDETIGQTLRTLGSSPFNKIRMCVFPKHYPYNLREPRAYPYEGTPMDSSVLTTDNFWQYNDESEGNDWDFYRLSPTYFQHLEKCVFELQKIGIEADLILFHPYDRWGFSSMTAEQDDFYLRYMIARFASFRNVWWSMANEYDLMRKKSHSDWQRMGNLVSMTDPYRHLCSIHNCVHFYDHTQNWITHCSIQRQDIYRTCENTEQWRSTYRKPVVLDEIAYEGNIQYGWGNIPAWEMTRRFWEAAVRGGYPGHSETVLHDSGILWWSHGGVLRGESVPRLAFLCKVMKEIPGMALRPYERSEFDEVCGVPLKPFGEKECMLYYYSFMQPSFRDFRFDYQTSWSVQVLDTWNMTVEDRGVFSGCFRVELPGKPYIAILLKKEKPVIL